MNIGPTEEVLDMGQIEEPTLRVLVIDHELSADTARGSNIRAIVSSLESRGMDVIKARSSDEGISVFIADPSLDCIIINGDLVQMEEERKVTPRLIPQLRLRNEDVPVFLITERATLSSIPLDDIQEINEYIWALEDTHDFISGRVEAEAKTYRKSLFPPFFGELIKFSQVHEYSWHTPGHAGGTAFLKSPVGSQFYRFFGEELFRSDLSVSVEALGSLLAHSGVIGEAERQAAKIFGADLTYFVTNGTSTSNKIVFFGTVVRDEIVLVDRNCHKSIEHALIMTATIPVYLIPTRNRYGIIGPIPAPEMRPETIREKIADNSLLSDRGDARPCLAVITNSTYDGLCYNVINVGSLLGKSVDRIHYDEAWYAYARFNPLYRERYGMHEGPRDGPTVFATQSTHKLLAALSQTSLIHVRQGRAPVEHDRFNESFMMHTTTSPLYTIIASNDVSAKMMSGTSGLALTSEAIDEAIAFRKMMSHIRRKLLENNSGDWWFDVWQPDVVLDSETGQRLIFTDVPDATLRADPRCWMLHPGEKWHGFKHLHDGYCMLDPIKVTLLTPGIAEDSSLEKTGIPAAVVSKFLEDKGIVPEKTGSYTILLLFSIGITKGKWGTLIAELFEFKRLFQENASLKDIFPDLIERAPDRYGIMGLADLCHEMHATMKDTSVTELMDRAFDLLPRPVMSGAEAYRHLVKNEVELVPVGKMGSRTVAVGIVPYPPGIPVLMSGEETGSQDGPILRYLCALQEFDRRFPGFEHEIHGVDMANGTYMAYCIRERDSSRV